LSRTRTGYEIASLGALLLAPLVLPLFPARIRLLLVLILGQRRCLGDLGLLRLPSIFCFDLELEVVASMSRPSMS
jgi:ABC-type molybdate transport system permease subunit